MLRYLEFAMHNKSCPDKLTFLARSSDLHAIITWQPIIAINFAVSYPIPAKEKKSRKM